jgi:hypothetical protein
MVNNLVVIGDIEKKIYHIRRKKVMLDRDLAELYGVETRALIQAVKRNIERFPEDFMFQLTKVEFDILRSQFVMSSWGGRRHLPYAFTEHGILMLSSVLNSERAIKVNIEIMRVFVKMRELSNSINDIKLRLEAMEKRYDRKFEIVFKVINSFLENNKNKNNRG